jgi:hypothetical protein
LPEKYEAAGADGLPDVSVTPSPLPHGRGRSAGQEQPHVEAGTIGSPASGFQAGEAPLPLQSHGKPGKKWRLDWRVAVVVAVIALAVGLSLLLLQHSRIRSVALPGILLGLSKESGPNAQALTNKIVGGVKAKAGDLMSHPSAAIYNGDGWGFAVVVGVPQTGGVMPTAQQMVQVERSIGHADAAAFPPGRAGGILTCFSDPFQNGRPVQCSWIDQVTAGQVIFEGGYTSTLADAAAKTRQLRDAIEQ